MESHRPKVEGLTTRQAVRLSSLAALPLLVLVMYLGQSTLLLRPPLLRKYVLQPGETLTDVADRFGVLEQDIEKMSSLPPGTAVEPGQVLSIPLSVLAPLRVWNVQWAGLLGTGLGLVIGLWLTHATGLLPPAQRTRMGLVALVLALTSYVISQICSSEAAAWITPLFVFNAVKDGLAWGTLIPLLCSALSGASASP